MRRNGISRFGSLLWWTPSLSRTVTLCFLIFTTGCFSGVSGDYGFLEKAEELSREGKYDEAIDAYRKHMTFRLSVKNRPEWENPYFYLILIGDIQLGQGDVEQAERSFLLAEESKVDAYLVADRFRGIARWYEDQGKLKESLDVLNRYRDRDPLLFETMADRIAKELTLEEDRSRSSSSAATTTKE